MSTPLMFCSSLCCCSFRALNPEVGVPRVQSRLVYNLGTKLQLTNQSYARQLQYTGNVTEPRLGLGVCHGSKWSSSNCTRPLYLAPSPEPRLPLCRASSEPPQIGSTLPSDSSNSTLAESLPPTSTNDVQALEKGSPIGIHLEDVMAQAFEWNEETVKRDSESRSQSAEISNLDSTVRLVETAMLAATAGLAFFLSNLLRLESYFGSFFPLPIVISSVRWGAAAGRKTMMATALLLFVLSGPLKSLSYLLMHGCLGLTMGALWKWRVPWPVSILACTLVRCAGLLGFVALSSWLVRENLLALVTINAHASLSHMLATMGSSVVPTMGFIYATSAAMLTINCISFVALLHLLYAIFLKRLGIAIAMPLPAWLERSL